MKRNSKIPTVPMVIVGCVIVFIIGVFNIVSLNYKQKNCTMPIIAEVTNVTVKKAGRRTTSKKYTRHFVYYVDNQIYNGKAKPITSYSSTELLKTGYVIKISVNPEKPEQYLVEDDVAHYESSWKTCIFFGTIGLAVAVCYIGKKFI